MNDAVYRVASASVRALLKAGRATEFITTFARVWLRHARFTTLLKTMRFDGVIDGGANVGELTNLVRDALPHADLVAIEPHPESAALLRKQGHRVIEAALWKESGTLTLSQPTASSTSCTVTGDAGNANADAPHWTVKALRLDEVPIFGQRLLVKLDLQGAEPTALEGMGELWSRSALARTRT